MEKEKEESDGRTGGKKLIAAFCSAINDDEGPKGRENIWLAYRGCVALSSFSPLHLILPLSPSLRTAYSQFPRRSPSSSSVVLTTTTTTTTTIEWRRRGYTHKRRQREKYSGHQKAFKVLFILCSRLHSVACSHVRVINRRPFASLCFFSLCSYSTSSSISHLQLYSRSAVLEIKIPRLRTNVNKRCIATDDVSKNGRALFRMATIRKELAARSFCRNI